MGYPFSSSSCFRTYVPFIVTLDWPSELGYRCPKGKDHHIEWSEYNCMIWCRICNFDYPSCLCMPDLKNGTEIFLDSYMFKSENLSLTLFMQPKDQWYLE